MDIFVYQNLNVLGKFGKNHNSYINANRADFGLKITKILYYLLLKILDFLKEKLIDIKMCHRTTQYNI